MTAISFLSFFFPHMKFDVQQKNMHTAESRLAFPGCEYSFGVSVAEIILAWQKFKASIWQGRRKAERIDRDWESNGGCCCCCYLFIYVFIIFLTVWKRFATLKRPDDSAGLERPTMKMTILTSALVRSILRHSDHLSVMLFHAWACGPKENGQQIACECQRLFLLKADMLVYVWTVPVKVVPSSK